jgi:hypothetical protein
MAYDKGTKYIRVNKLIELLLTLPPHYEIEPNQVGNLSIYDGPGKWKGFIDLNHEVVDLPDNDVS